uniref:Uncharacterized protein n=1 Tax=viral metagenome TaxID=1070528 RepID=A0A6M3L8I4_9ZZZZ
MDKEKRGFTCGLVYAAAQCFRNGFEPVGEFLWNESGFKKRDLAVCDEYDAKEIRKYFNFSQTDNTRKCRHPRLIYDGIAADCPDCDFVK